MSMASIGKNNLVNIGWERRPTLPQNATQLVICSHSKYLFYCPKFNNPQCFQYHNNFCFVKNVFFMPLYQICLLCPHLDTDISQAISQLGYPFDSIMASKTKHGKCHKRRYNSPIFIGSKCRLGTLAFSEEKHANRREATSRVAVILLIHSNPSWYHRLRHRMAWHTQPV